MIRLMIRFCIVDLFPRLHRFKKRDCHANNTKPSEQVLRLNKKMHRMVRRGQLVLMAWVRQGWGSTGKIDSDARQERVEKRARLHHMVACGMLELESQEPCQSYASFVLNYLTLQAATAGWEQAARFPLQDHNDPHERRDLAHHWAKDWLQHLIH